MSVYLDIEKKLGKFTLKVKLDAENEVLALLGASGCGKSMTLKCITGIVKPDRGKIVVDGVTLFDSEKHINLAPQKRRVGLMFQNYALFPNMTVKQNIYTGTIRDIDRKKRENIVNEIIEKFDLKAVADHYPSELSGGQQQRTALARIFVSNPGILLLDEPFSALDSHLRFKIEQEVKEKLLEYGKTVIIVSHDRDEVFRLSDKIAVINEGQVEAFGTRDEVFKNPRTKSSAILTGCKNISAIRKIDEHHVYAVEWGIELETENEVLDSKYIGIRMHDISLGEGKNSLLCDVVGYIENPFSYTGMLSFSDKEECTTVGIELEKDVWHNLQQGRIRVNLPPDKILLLKK